MIRNTISVVTETMRLRVILFFGNAIIAHALARFVHLAYDILPGEIPYPNDTRSHSDDVAITLQPSLSGTYHDGKLSKVLYRDIRKGACSWIAVVRLSPKVSIHNAKLPATPDRQRRGFTAGREKGFTGRLISTLRSVMLHNNRILKLQHTIINLLICAVTPLQNGI